ncbi:MAG: DUF952 domain-containing protein [Cyanobacteria bacterium J06623_4]
MNRDNMIFHITQQADWKAAQLAGEYRAPSLESEGFIHFSEAGQVAAVAARFYSGQAGLVLLETDCDRLTSELRYDAVPGHGRFPHLYGPLNLDAVIAVHDFDPDQPAMQRFTQR